MLQSYDDITRALTRLTRLVHYYHFLWMDEGHEGAHPECTTFSYDEISQEAKRCCSCVAKPLWWDENGTPRFEPHHPNLCADIYAKEVALLLISCQCCGRKYDVQMSSCFASIAEKSLATLIREGTIHYGDPPCDGCVAGATMNCWDLRVIEFWTRESNLARVPELEIDLPDMCDPDRSEAHEISEEPS